MKNTHIEGKWVYNFCPVSEFSPKGHFTIKERVGGGIIAILPVPMWGCGGCKMEANVRLIAFAPELGNLLEKYVDLTKNFTNKEVGDNEYAMFAVTYAKVIELLDLINEDKNIRAAKK